MTNKLAHQSTVRYHLTLVLVVIIKEKKITKTGKDAEKGILSYSIHWNVNDTAIMEKVCMLLKKLEIELLYYPTVALLHTHPKERESVGQRDICIPIFLFQHYSQ